MSNLALSEIEEICRLFKAGDKISEIAVNGNFSRETVYTHLRSKGLICPKQDPKFLEAHKKFNGNVSDAAKALGIYKSTIWRKWKAYRLPIPNEKPRRKEGKHNPLEHLLVCLEREIVGEVNAADKTYFLTRSAMLRYVQEHGLTLTKDDFDTVKNYISQDLQYVKLPSNQDPCVVRGEEMRYRLFFLLGKIFITDIKIRV